MLSEKERREARNEAVAALKISCGKCHNFMRNLGEWPTCINGETKETVQAARWVCHTCKYPVFTESGEQHQASYHVFIPLE